MKIVLTGGTGFIGGALIRRLHARGDALVVLTRRQVPAGTFPDGVRTVLWDGKRQGAWSAEIDGSDAVVNLAGEPIAGGRWTPARKDRILRSRVDASRAVVQACMAARQRPAVLVSASAIGYYAGTGDQPALESEGPGSGFLADVAVAWEAEAEKVAAAGVRVVIPRIGIVLDRTHGALPRMLLPYRLYAGGPLGSGKQWFPWIHADDVIGAMVFALDTPGLSGPVNLTSPEPTTMAAFGRALGSALQRPSWLAVPAPVIRLVLGEMAILVLEGRPVLPARLLEHGYPFAHPRLHEALHALLTAS